MEMITSLYGMSKPELKHVKQREKKVAEAIAYLGEKYLLAKCVEKKQ